MYEYIFGFKNKNYNSYKKGCCKCNPKQETILIYEHYIQLHSTFHLDFPPHQIELPKTGNNLILLPSNIK